MFGDGGGGGGSSRSTTRHPGDREGYLSPEALKTADIVASAVDEDDDDDVVQGTDDNPEGNGTVLGMSTIGGPFSALTPSMQPSQVL